MSNYRPLFKTEHGFHHGKSSKWVEDNNATFSPRMRRRSLGVARLWRPISRTFELKEINQCSISTEPVYEWRDTASS